MSRTAHRLSRKYLRSATRYTGDRKSVPLFPFRIPRDHPSCVSPSIVIEITLSLSLFFPRSSARKRASIEYTFASKCTRGNMGDDNVDGSSSCERVRNRTFMKCR